MMSIIYCNDHDMQYDSDFHIDCPICESMTNMTVKRLKKWLEEFPDDMEIYVSSDSEGNKFVPLCELGEYKFDGNDIHEINDPESKDLPTVLVIWPE